MFSNGFRALLLALLTGLTVLGGSDTVKISSLPLLSWRQGWGALRVDRSVGGNPITLHGHLFRTGLGTHAESELVYALDRRFTRFRSVVGVDDEMIPYGKSSVAFEVFADGRLIFDSGIMRNSTAAKYVDVDIAGVRELRLVVTDAGDGIEDDHADWADAVLVGSPSSVQINRAAYEVRASGLAAQLTSDGRVIAVRLSSGGPWVRAHAETRLPGTTYLGKPSVLSVPGGVSIERPLIVTGHKCMLADRFTADGGSLRWEIDIKGYGSPWTTPIDTVLTWPNVSHFKFWTAWQDPVQGHPSTHMGDSDFAWVDPLEPQPFRNRTWTYGEAPDTNWWSGDVFTVPLLMILKPGGRALSVIQAPGDFMPEASLVSSSEGSVVLCRSQRRLGEGRTVRFSMNLVSGPADVRDPLRWIVARYPAYFDPPNPDVGALEGCAAYSGDERVLDPKAVSRLRAMDFRTMWKLSDDYVYMGMFGPPVDDPDLHWNRVDDSGSPPNYKPSWTSYARLNDYAKMLKSRGFHLLSYFNMFEYGHDNHESNSDPKDPDLWKDPVGYLDAHFPNAPVRDSKGSPFGAWQGGWLLDPGDSRYRDHLADQAMRHIRLIPDADGICVDRGDYTDLFNSRGDDGVSFVDGSPARSMAFSWEAMMDRFGALMHAHHKFVFANLMHARLDLARQLDGLYMEFGNQPTVLNGAAFLCLNKALLAWTRNEDKLDDAFFQRHLYLGAFPTAPYPTNNHCIQPSPERDRWYIDYGPLFEALASRKWVLQPGVVSAVGAKANLFQTPRGYVVPVVFANARKVVALTLQGVRVGKAYVLHPGHSRREPIQIERHGGRLKVNVPIERGCAVVVFSSR